MAALRGRLRVFATTWLMFQVAWLAALVPRDCCAAHRPVQLAETRCHETPPPPADHSGHGAAQPAVAASVHQAPAPALPVECRMSGLCDGPMAALATLLSSHGIMPASATSLPRLHANPAWVAFPQGVIGRFEPPDLPPPRA